MLDIYFLPKIYIMLTHRSFGTKEDKLQNHFLVWIPCKYNAPWKQNKWISWKSSHWYFTQVSKYVSTTKACLNFYSTQTDRTGETSRAQFNGILHIFSPPCLTIAEGDMQLPGYRRLSSPLCLWSSILQVMIMRLIQWTAQSLLTSLGSAGDRNILFLSHLFTEESDNSNVGSVNEISLADFKHLPIKLNLSRAVWSSCFVRWINLLPHQSSKIEKNLHSWSTIPKWQDDMAIHVRYRVLSDEEGKIKNIAASDAFISWFPLVLPSLPLSPYYFVACFLLICLLSLSLFLSSLSFTLILLSSLSHFISNYEHVHVYSVLKKCIKQLLLRSTCIWARDNIL